MPTPTTELETLRECQDRALHREGIPMFVALADERGVPGPTPGGCSTAVVERMDHYRGVLAGTRREDDMGVVVSILSVTAYEDFNSSVSP